jgi:hypothetical protein
VTVIARQATAPGRRFLDFLRPGRRILVGGRPIRWRMEQMILWSAILAACGAALVAGLYFNLLEVHWYVHLGSTQFQLFDLKKWWDGGMGFIHSAAWPLFRHGFRDDGEPAVATMLVSTVMAKPKWWHTRVGKIRLATAPALLGALAIALIFCAVWLQFFGLPGAWHWLHTATHGTWPSRWDPGAPWVSIWAAGETVAFGFVVGRILHRVWAPIGATLQGYGTDWLARKSPDAEPLWVRHPVAAPVIRERVSLAITSGEARKAADRHRVVARERTRAQTALHVLLRVAIALGVLVVLYLMVTGFIAHFWVGTGHSFPYLAPNG